MAQPAAHLSYYSQPSLGRDGSAFIRDSCARGGRQGQSHRGCSTPTASVSHQGEGLPPALATSGPATRHLLPPELRPSFPPREGPSCFSNTAISCKWTSGNSATEGTKLALHHALLFVNCTKPRFRSWTFPNVEDCSCLHFLLWVPPLRRSHSPSLSPTLQYLIPRALHLHCPSGFIDHHPTLVHKFPESKNTVYSAPLPLEHWRYPGGACRMYE